MKSTIPLAILFCTIRWKSQLVDGTPAECPELTEPPFTVNIPHETECGKFYICQKNKKIEINCPSFLEYNAKLQICDWPEKANCVLQPKSERYPDPNSPNCITAATSTSHEYEDEEYKEAECREDEHLPHETSCNQYYRCVYGRRVLKICDHNMRFNKELGNCDFQYNVRCDSSSAEDMVKRDAFYEDDYIEAPIDLSERNDWEQFLNQKLDQTSTESVSGSVDYLNTDKYQIFPEECPEVTDPYEPVLIPHDKKCNAYYKCSNGKKQPLLCPGMLQFNPKILLCDLPKNVKCIERKSKTSETPACPRTECQSSTMYLPSMTDPRKFTRCDNGKQISGECPNGLVFDVKLKVCNLAHLAETIPQ